MNEALAEAAASNCSIRITVPAPTATPRSAAALATAAAGAGRWSDLDLHLERVREGLSRIEVLEPDLAWALELAGDLAASGSRSSPARKAWKLALGLQNTVDPARAKITERKLASAR